MLIVGRIQERKDGGLLHFWRVGCFGLRIQVVTLASKSTLSAFNCIPRVAP